MKVKTLQWEEFDNGFQTKEVTPLNLCYSVYKSLSANLTNCWSCIIWIADIEKVLDVDNTSYDTLDEAKEACQKHYENLILSGLEEI